MKPSLMTITGNKMAETSTSESKFLHQGIAARSFERRFQLADHVQVVGAELENGLLHVVLKRELPEAMKPRQIKVATAKSGQKTIEGKKAA